MRVADLESIRIKLASPEEILSWSRGEVTKPETINYRTQRAEKDGLFCEKIFGPEKDYECYCGKYRRIRYKGIVCDRCGVEVTKSSVRRERMGHIKLACPVAHIWFLRSVPSRMGMVFDVPVQQLERIIYFAAYIVTNVSEAAKKKVLEKIDAEYKIKRNKFLASESKDQKGTSSSQARAKRNKFLASENKKPTVRTQDEKKLKTVLEEIKTARDRAREEVLSLKPLRVLSELEFQKFSFKYGECFEGDTGAETLRKIFEKIDLKAEIAKMGAELEKASPMNKRKILRRLKLLQGMGKAGVRPEWMFLTVLPILPPDLRPMVQLDGGRYASSDLNDLYRRVINRNTRLKYLLEIDAPEVIVRNEKRMLQEAVDALIDNGMRKGTMTQATTGGRRLLKSLTDMLKGKRGRFRQNLLGKRVDYSGRSVIAVGPELKLHQCGIPKKMALELFKPFVIKKILDKELAYNVRGAARLIEQETDEVWAILEEIAKDKLVLLNRAPTLHRLGIQAFQPVLTEGESIRIHPLVCKAFNADFDGDQMAVHVPLSEEAQKEAREIMLSTLNLLKPATGMPINTPTEDIILGCYWLTKIIDGRKGEGKIFGTPEEAIIVCEFGDVDLKAKIKVRMPARSVTSVAGGPARRSLGEGGKEGFVETSVGRILFNETLPTDFPFQNALMNSRTLEKSLREIIEKYGPVKSQETFDKIKDLGFEGATRSGITWGMDDLIVPPEKKGIVEKAEKEIEQINNYYKRGLLSKEEKTSKVIEVWQKAKSEIEKLVPKTLPDTGPVFQMVDAGARGSWGQPVQMAGMKGLVINPAGQIIELPVKNSFKEGLDVLEYFISTHGARKGTADTALRTSTAGYLTRRLVDVAHEVIVSEDDCKDNQGIEIFMQDAEDISQNFVFKILGRVALEDVRVKGPDGKIKTVVKKGEIIDWKRAEQISEGKVEKVRLRSPISCKSIMGVCQQCYGWDLGNNQLIKIGEAAGVVAAQAIGEPGTQLTMRTFHTGGVAGGGDITFGLPRVQEIFEAREPGGKAEISQVEGKVLEITPEKVIKIKVNPHTTTRIIPLLRPGRQSSFGVGVKAPKKLKDEIVEYKIPPKMAVYVEPGQGVKKGQQLCEGNIDLKELLKAGGREEAQRYIIKEIQKIYVSQGAIIHDKHIEVIVRQMFSRVRIKDAGQSDFTAGEIVERAKFLEINAALKKERKKLALGSPTLLGISRVALTTNSFLSAASFQETSRVLIRASIEGKEDKLRGLKENVIIGKLIPAGTGFRRK